MDKVSYGTITLVKSGDSQHFWMTPLDYTTPSGHTLKAGEYITNIAIDDFKTNPRGNYLTIRSDEIGLYNGLLPVMTLTGQALSFYRPGTATADATLNANGLVLNKGGINVGTPATSNFLYISTESYGNNYQIGSSIDISDWKQIIGTKFGVRADGTLYANNAFISGQITVGAGSNVYTIDDLDTQANAINDRIENQSDALQIIDNRTEELGNNYEVLTTDVNQLKQINNYVTIQNNPPRIDLVVGDNKLSLTHTQVQILSESQLASWFAGDSTYNKKIITGEIYPRYITGSVDSSSISLTGGFGWIARKNGNLSLKIIRI